MKSTISFVFVIICTVVLAAHESQAKKGCNAYGHACYGGHGKRSLTLGSLVGGGNGNNLVRGNSNNNNNNINNEQDDMRPEALLQMFPNEASILTDGDFDAYPRYRLIKIMKSWLGGHPRRASERLNDIDYPISGEMLSRDNNNLFN